MERIKICSVTETEHRHPSPWWQFFSKYKGTVAGLGQLTLIIYVNDNQVISFSFKRWWWLGWSPFN